jgi:hypothetical protein
VQCRVRARSRRGADLDFDLFARGEVDACEALREHFTVRQERACLVEAADEELADARLGPERECVERESVVRAEKGLHCIKRGQLRLERMHVRTRPPCEKTLRELAGVAADVEDDGLRRKAQVADVGIMEPQLERVQPQPDAHLVAPMQRRQKRPQSLLHIHSNEHS